MFSREFTEKIHRTFFIEHLRATVSVFVVGKPWRVSFQLFINWLISQFLNIFKIFFWKSMFMFVGIKEQHFILCGVS